MLNRLLIILLFLVAPSLVEAKCTGVVGQPIPTSSTETYTLGDGTVVPCAELLIVDRSPLMIAISDGSFDFKPTDSYSQHNNGVTYKFDQVYTGYINSFANLFAGASGFTNEWLPYAYRVRKNSTENCCR